MTELKLKQYKELEFNLSRALLLFANVQPNKTAADYIDGMPVTSINTESILRLHASDKSKTLSNYKEMLAVGVDISKVIPSCEETRPYLDSIVKVVEGNALGQFKNELQYISFDRKSFKFIVNSNGRLALQNAIVKLNGKAENLYKTVMSVHKQLKDEDAKAPLVIFSATHSDFTKNIVHMSTGDLLEDNLVYQIKQIVG